MIRLAAQFAPGPWSTRGPPPVFPNVRPARVPAGSVRPTCVVPVVDSVRTVGQGFTAVGEREPVRLKLLGIGAALAAAVGVSAGGYAAPVAATSDGAVRTPAGCPTPPSSEMVAEEDRVSSVVPAVTAPTATDHVRAGIDLRGLLDDLRHLSGRFEPVADFVLPSTGIAVTVLSDGPIVVDAEALDRLTRLPLSQPELFRDARVGEVQRCYAQRMLVDRELAGRTLRLLVPADPATCFRAGRLVTFGNDDEARVCDSAGVTLPEVSLSPRLLGMDLADARAPATVVVAAATDPRRGDPELVVAGLLLHEFHHVVENAFGLVPWTGPLRHYEQRAYYVEREVRRHLRSRGLALPRPIRFPAPAVSSP